MSMAESLWTPEWEEAGGTVCVAGSRWLPWVKAEPPPLPRLVLSWQVHRHRTAWVLEEPPPWPPHTALSHCHSPSTEARVLFFNKESAHILLNSL